MPDRNTMLYWLAQVCRDKRMDAAPKVKALDIASRLRYHLPRGVSVDNSTISRFEKGTIWPRTPMDAIVRSYAEELRLQPIELWTEALAMWNDHLSAEAAAEIKRGAEAQRASTARAADKPRAASRKPPARGRAASPAANGG